MSKFYAILTSAAVLCAAVAVPALAEDIPGKKLLEEKCTMCHSLDRIKAKKADVNGWTQVVERMKGKAMGAISDSDAKEIIKYVSTINGN